MSVKKFLLNLSEFRSKAEGFSDLLNYAYLVDEGIMLNKNGSLTAVLQYQAPDVFSAIDDERNSKARQINQLLTKFESDWAIQFDSIRVPIQEYLDTNKSFFTDKITKTIDIEREFFFNSSKTLYNTHTYITLTYLPPLKTRSKIINMMFEDDSIKEDVRGDKIVEYFKNKINEFVSLSSATFIDIKQLKQEKIINIDGTISYKDNLLAFLNNCITGEYHKILYPIANINIDNLLSYPFISGLSPKIKDHYIQTISINGFPLETYPDILDRLSNFDGDYRWNTKFVYVDQYESVGVLNSVRKKWAQKQRGLIQAMFPTESIKLDLDAVTKVHEIDSALAETNSGVIKNGYYNTTIIVFAKTIEELNATVTEIRKKIETGGFTTYIENVNTIESYLGSLPGHIVQNLRRYFISTMNLAHLLPLSTMWMGNKYNECDKYPPHSPALLKAVAGTTPFNLNLHVGDIGHTLIFGPTGAGKSTLLATIVAQAKRYNNVQIFAFDKGKSLYPLTAAIGGNHYDVAGDDDKLAFAPLSDLQTNNDIAWAENYILTLVELQGIKPSPSDKQLIHHALQLHVANNSKSLTDYISNVQSTELRAALSHYSINGMMGHLLDAESDNLSLSNLSVFEIEDLMNLKFEDAIPVMLYLFHRIKKSLDGRPTFLILDEAWIMLGHPVFRDEIKEWLKVLRKANCAVVLATQALSDAAKSGILDVLQESCPTKIFLPNPEAFNQGSENNWGPYDFYKLFGLNEREIEIIEISTQKREYYYKSPYGSRLFNLMHGEFALSFVGASSKDDIKKIKELQSEYGDNWVQKWLEYRKLGHEIIDYYNNLKV